MDFFRTQLVRETPPEWIPDHPVSGPAAVADMMRCAGFTDAPQESFIVFFLDARHNIRGFSEITRGTADMSVIHARETFREAIQRNACAIVLSHNHPSGQPFPSPEDRTVTEALVKAGQVLGIPVLDHVVVGTEGLYSFAEEGAM